MYPPTDDELDAAAERGRRAEETEPRAHSARYDPEQGRVIVELASGGTVAFSARIVQGLEDATDAEIAEVELLGNGYGLHWPTRDVDISIPGIVAGRFGTKGYMTRRAAHATSPAKAAAARAKDGRPPKTAPGGG